MIASAIPLLLLITVRLFLWKRFNNPYNHSEFLQIAASYRDTGRLEIGYDFYPSWRKHPLLLKEYQGYCCLLGLVLRLTKWHSFRMARLFQLIITVVLAWSLERIMPKGLSWFPYVALTVCIATLYLSVMITPDMMLMAETALAMMIFQIQPDLGPWACAVGLGLLGWAGIRTKSSGFILSLSILITAGFVLPGLEPLIITILFTILPLALDAFKKRENVILQLIRTQIKAFGYSLDDERACLPPLELGRRKIKDKFRGAIMLILKGGLAAINPFSSFSLFRSNGLFYLSGILGMGFALTQGPGRPISLLLLFSWSYFALTLIFFSLLKRHFHFAARAGGTLAPLWILWTAQWIPDLEYSGPLLIWVLFIFEGFRSIKLISSDGKKILLESIQPLSDSDKVGPVILKLKGIIKPRDLLFLTYRDLVSFGMALGAWQAVIELENATVPIVCKYIDYFTHDKRYNNIYLILPPNAHVFFDKDKQHHYIEIPEFAARFKQIHGSDNLNGYRIFEAIRPVVYRDLTSYEGLSPDQIKNMSIDFGALKPNC